MRKLILFIYGALLALGIWLCSKQVEFSISTDSQRLISNLSRWTLGINVTIGALLAFIRYRYFGAQDYLASRDSKLRNCIPIIGFGLKNSVWLMLAAILALPSLSQSLWGDELWSWRESIGGRFQRDNNPDGADWLYWEQLGWDQTTWRYLTTNHHFLYALGGRASNETWQSLGGRLPWEFSEVALRVLPLALSLVGVMCWARLLLPISRVAAFLVPPLLAIHPWFLRYATEARGYAFLFALIPLLLISLREGAQQGYRKYWVAIALLQFLALYAWPGVAPTLIGIQIASFFWIRRTPSAAARHQRWYLFVANVASAMIFLQMIAPCWPQVAEYLSGEVPSRSVGWHWILNEFTWFALGCDSIDHLEYSDRNPLYITAEGLLRARPVTTMLSIVLFSGALLLGIRKWCRSKALGAPILLAIGIATVATWALALVTGTALYEWYFVHLLPLAVCLVALGIGSTVCGLGTRFRLVRAATVPVSFAIVAIIGLAYIPQIRSMRSRSLDPRRESVALTRSDAPLTNPVHLETITAHCGQQSLSYDPHGYPLDKANAAPGEAPGLVQLMRMADLSDATLWVNVGGLGVFETEYPDVAEQLAQNELFELVHEVHGRAPQFERHLYRYRGGIFDFLKGL